ncbi:hypothetical protein PQQ51_04810 [Paraburkholderia xenovorans]|uniref:hypothetical protein n=1 Tax=Paraburkholderia xenovorans TaxID=36873 RepID=UPI0038B73B64
MTTQQDGGIVNGYLTEFMQLGMKAYAGADVAKENRALVEKAMKHLDVWVDGDKLQNKRNLIAGLRSRAEIAAATNPAQAEVLMDAHDLAAARLAT